MQNGEGTHWPTDLVAQLGSPGTNRLDVGVGQGAVGRAVALARLEVDLAETLRLRFPALK